MSQTMYADHAEYVHTFFTVKGKHNIFGVHNLWVFLMRKSEAKIQRLGELPIASFTMHQTNVSRIFVKLVAMKLALQQRQSCTAQQDETQMQAYTALTSCSAYTQILT